MDIDYNPFDLIRAADYSDKQISDFWVDFKGGGLQSLIEPKSAISKHILGGKGSGKTHLMRYCSYPVQKLRLPNGSIEDLVAEGYVGVFMRANTLDTGKFSGKGQDSEKWGALFNFYFELRLVENLISTLIEISSLGEHVATALNGLTSQIIALLDEEPKTYFPTSLSQLLDYFVSLRKSVDFSVNNCVFTRKLDIEICLSPGSLLFGIPSLVSKNVAALKDVRFIYLIDEVENLTKEQQRFINTLIRHSVEPCTFRLGARLYGIKTLANYGTDEENKEGSEFKALYLDQIMRQNSVAYKEFARQLCAKRLFDAGLIAEAAESGRTKDRLQTFFETLNSDNYYESHTKSLVGNTASKDRPYFKRLREQLITKSETRRALKNAQADQIVKILSVEQYPLLEKANIFMLYQDWYRGKDLLDAAKIIANESKQFIAGENSRAKTLYGHFALDLLAQLYRDHRQQTSPMYAGFDSFVRMSACVPRNLLVILQSVYKWAAFNGNRPFREGPIPISTQSEAVIQSAGFFFDEDARPGADVPNVQRAVERLAEYLREVRFSSKPVEVSPLAFSLNASELSDRAKYILKRAENWSYIFRNPRGRPSANSQRLDEKFQLNPMLSPRWDLPVSVRGDVRLSTKVAEAIFGDVSSDAFQVELSEATAGMKAPAFAKSKPRVVEKPTEATHETSKNLTFNFGADHEL
ncbi:hypothetical protein CXF92_00465 [Pseudomonas sp. Choline-3u-10]|uniref:ORC-CDC6 family AAA ATPase n=1 Tax=Pseudomonas sp. Choline-3u-10 TaxID=2058311 RepID=UPI000C32DE50|nr:hypothetical protein [Pseudomonas sp. Choline-3u-10]PKG96306.1 hypothetical protein CXF92_00465 [Pseudomonas sp. Choline-3u-10]